MVRPTSAPRPRSPVHCRPPRTRPLNREVSSGAPDGNGSSALSCGSNVARSWGERHHPTSRVPLQPLALPIHSSIPQPRTPITPTRTGPRRTPLPPPPCTHHLLVSPPGQIPDFFLRSFELFWVIFQTPTMTSYKFNLEKNGSRFSSLNCFTSAPLKVLCEGFWQFG